MFFFFLVDSHYIIHIILYFDFLHYILFIIAALTLHFLLGIDEVHFILFSSLSVPLKLLVESKLWPIFHKEVGVSSFNVSTVSF